MGQRNLGRVVGENGITPHVGESGNWYLGETDTGVRAQGLDGAPGVNGSDGITPHIGDNGNWFIGQTDTGVRAQGSQGATGATGPQGPTGPAGVVNRGVANGVASLDANTLVPREQLPLASVGSGSDNPSGAGGRGTVKITVSGSTAYIWTT